MYFSVIWCPILHCFLRLSYFESIKKRIPYISNKTTRTFTCFFLPSNITANQSSVVCQRKYHHSLTSLVCFYLCQPSLFQRKSISPKAPHRTKKKTKRKPEKIANLSIFRLCFLRHARGTFSGGTWRRCDVVAVSCSTVSSRASRT